MSKQVSKTLIFCCSCNRRIQAELVTGKEIYPHRYDLADLPFWRCSTCRNYVGCHHKTKDRTKPLGCIPSEEIRAIRRQIHQVIDPLWMAGRHHRKEIYKMLAERLGIEKYHTGRVDSVGFANKVLSKAKELAEDLAHNGNR